jgi:hypothetical protein
LNGAEVVAECEPLSGGEMIVHGMGMMTEEIIVDPIAVEVLSREEYVRVLLIWSAWVASW